MADLTKGPKKPKKKGSKSNPVAKKEVTVYAPNQDAYKFLKDRIRSTSTDKKGKRWWINTSDTKDEKLYVADPNGGTPTYRTKKYPSSGNILTNPDFKKSMDTTGFAKGKKTFTINSIKKSGGKDGELKKITTKSAKIPRSKVLSTLDKWKGAASKMTSKKSKKG